MLLLLIGFACVSALALFLLCPRFRRGRLVVAPGEETVRIVLPFRPAFVNVYFGRRRQPPPSCADLEDTITNLEILNDGFRFDYKVETGVRVIKWVARE